MTMKKNNQKKKGGFKPGILLIILVVLIAGVVAFLFVKGKKKEPEVEKTVLADPCIESSVTVGATGDILIHSPILDSISYSGYDFSGIFSLTGEYYSKPDIMCANLEVTCGGEESGAYSGYPTFNCPDTIVSTLAASGVDVFLTANNHSYDTGYYGMMRTLDVITANGLEYLGTRKSTDEHFVMVKQINGIKVGMVNYTYDTRESAWDTKSLNGITMREDAQDLVNSFCYSDLESLYSSVNDSLNQMRMLGIDCKIVFVHWGNEYTDEPNEYEYEIAQRICELGADVIIGGHPHVIQKYETLTSSTGHQTLCLYSMGNELSNQRAEYMYEDDNRGYTEDGLIFEVTISKFNNGKVKITGLKIIPTWVQLSGGQYKVIVCDDEKTAGEWGADDPWSAINSYNRTIGRLGSSYNAYRLSKNQLAVPEWLE